MKPNCYQCIHRRNVPGDAHSQCAHPKAGPSDGSNMLDAIIQMARGKHNSGSRELEIKGNLHGIRSGWFMWPYNFDPCWLENCNGFEQKEEIK